MEFGPDTETIRRWLQKRQTYQTDSGRHRGADAAPEEAVFLTGAPVAPPARSAGPDSRAAEQSVLDALGTAPAPQPAPAPSGRADGHTAARSVLEELGAVAPSPAPAAEEPPPARVAAAAVPHREESSGRTTDITFPPKRGVRRALSITLLLVLAGTAYAGYLAHQSPSLGTYGVAATLGVLLLAVWAVRAGTTMTEVRIHRGQLEIRRGGGLEVVDLANPYTPVAMLGLPGHRGWKVIVERPDRPLLQVDASLVEPHAFMDSLLRMRPDLWEWAAENARELVGAPAPAES